MPNITKPVSLRSLLAMIAEVFPGAAASSP
jgi:hypothetical protein